MLTKEERNTRSDPWLSYVSLWTQFAVLFLTFPLLGSVPMNFPIQCRNCGNMVSFSRSKVPYKEDCSLYYLIEIGKNGIALNAELYRYCNARKETLSCKALFGITCCWNWRIARAEQIARNTDVTTALILTPFLKALRNGVRRYADTLSSSTTVINFLLDIVQDEKWNEVIVDSNLTDNNFYYGYNDNHVSFLTSSTSSGSSSRSRRGAWLDTDNGTTHLDIRYMGMQTIERPKSVSSGGSSFPSASSTQFEIQSMPSSSSSTMYSQLSSGVSWFSWTISFALLLSVVELFFFHCSIVCSPAHKIFPAMIEPFSGVKFYIIPSTASRLKENNQRMISILRTGMALQETTINDNVTHVICNSSDFVLAQKTTSDSVFCCYVTPKWVFISQSLRYCLPVVCIQCWFE